MFNYMVDMSTVDINPEETRTIAVEGNVNRFEHRRASQ